MILVIFTGHGWRRPIMPAMMPGFVRLQGYLNFIPFLREFRSHGSFAAWGFDGDTPGTKERIIGGQKWQGQGHHQTEDYKSEQRMVTIRLFGHN
jgi:hypothetical protein